MFYYIVLSIQCIWMLHCSVLTHDFVVIKLLAKTLLINHKFWEFKAIELKLSRNCFYQMEQIWGVRLKISSFV